MKVFYNRIFNQIKLYKNKCYFGVQTIKWHIQYYWAKFSKKYPLNTKILNIDYSGSNRITILAPHADDEWIGTYSILKSRPKNLNVIYFNLYGGNNSSHNIKVRDSEIVHSSEYWKFNLINNYGYDLEGLVSILKETTFCFVPSPYDWHDEHRSVFQLFVKAYTYLSVSEKNNLKVYYYSVSVPHSNKELLYYIPISKGELFEKWHKFSNIYHSQNFMPSIRYKLQLRLISKQVAYAVQTFIAADNDRIMCDLHKTYDTEFVNKIKRTQVYINNILTVRTIINNI